MDDERLLVGGRRGLNKAGLGLVPVLGRLARANAAGDVAEARGRSGQEVGLGRSGGRRGRHRRRAGKVARLVADRLRGRVQVGDVGT
jgi:hypothetical protein